MVFWVFLVVACIVCFYVFWLFLFMFVCFVVVFRHLEIPSIHIGNSFQCSVNSQLVHAYLPLKN